MHISLVILSGFLLLISPKLKGQNGFQAIVQVMDTIPDSLTFSTRNIADYINKNFSQDTDKLAAIFTWTARNIAYDPGDERLFLAADELDAYIEETLYRRKGLCQAYAEVVHDICIKTGIPSQVISGFAFAERGQPPVSHAWIAAFNSAGWKLYDPTYGAGYVEDSIFVQDFDTLYYDTKAEFLIRTHYPFDPMWQLNPQPVTMHEFLSGTASDTLKGNYFNFNDTIASHMALDERGQLVSERRRIMAYGEENPVLMNYVAVIDQQLEFYKISENVDIYNQCLENYNLAISLYNANFINFKSDNLSESKKQDLLNKVEKIRVLLSDASRQLTEIDSHDEAFDLDIITMKQNISAFMQSVVDKEKKLQK